jgi:hypothetical protein
MQVFGRIFSVLVIAAAMAAAIVGLAFWQEQGGGVLQAPPMSQE